MQHNTFEMSHAVHERQQRLRQEAALDRLANEARQGEAPRPDHIARTLTGFAALIRRLFVARRPATANTSASGLRRTTQTMPAIRG